MGIKFLQNIDAERNKFEEAGFEEVSQLPTTNLFAGREVIFNGLKYMYENSEQGWVRQRPLLDSYFKNQEINNYGNPFSSQKTMYTTTIHNALYAADKRYNVNVVIYNSDDTIYTNVTGVSMLFDGSYENQLTIPAGKKCVVTIEGHYLFAQYPYGTIWLQTYYGSQEKSVSCRVNANFASTGIGWFNLPMTALSGSGQKQYKSGFNNYFNLSIIEITVVAADDKPAILTEIEMALSRPNLSDFPVLLKYGGIMYGELQAPRFIKTGGTATQMLMANGSTKDISGFASPEDIPEKLPNPNPIIIKTADGVSVRYDGSTSGGVILEAGDNAELTATQDSDDTMTVKFGAVVPQTLPNPNALNIMVLDSEGALLGSSIVYDGVATKYFELIEGYGIELTNSNLSNGQAIAVNLKQIAGTTLLGNVNGTTGTPQAVTMTQLRTMLGSLMLNDISVTLGGNSSYTLPCYIDYKGTRYQCRISSDSTGLQIYRAGVWVTIGKFCRCSTRGTITNSNIDSWYKDTVPNYEMDESVSAALFAEDLTTKFGMSIAGTWTGKTVTLNLASVSIKDTKSAWEMLKKNMGDCFPSDSVERIRYYYNVAIPSGEVVTKIELSYHNGVGMCTVHFYTEG